MSTSPQVRLDVRLKAGIKFDPEADVYVTYAPALQLSSQGETRITAKNALADAVEMLLISAYEKGLLDKVLRGAGLAPVSDRSRQDDIRSSGEEYIRVEAIELEEKHFEDIFDVPATLQLTNTGAMPVCQH